MTKKYLIGIDEVGRGSLAGPVTVGAVAISNDLKLTTGNQQLKDSKKLTAKQREEWFRYIKNHPDIFYVIAHVYPSVIDRINITQAANLAATRALLKLLTCSKLPNYQITQLSVYLDGGLYIDKTLLETDNLQLRTVVRGDEKYSCVKLASIIAKVTRDKYMTRKHRIFPQYCFNNHKGYGTRRHRQAIKKHGSSLVHRLTFLKRFRTIP
jgi:ribonuclease HII